LAALEAAHGAGLLTGILTNDVSVFHEEGWVERVPFVGRVDAYVDASLSGVLKPDPRAYRRVLGELHVRAEEAVFVDDMPHNVCGASDVGMSSVLFDVTDPAGSYERVLAAAGLDAQVR
jgi:putative hydrolase of the HAD superfamily